MNKDILKKLIKIASNQQKIINKLAQRIPNFRDTEEDPQFEGPLEDRPLTNEEIGGPGDDLLDDTTDLTTEDFSDNISNLKDDPDYGINSPVSVENRDADWDDVPETKEEKNKRYDKWLDMDPEDPKNAKYFS